MSCAKMLDENKALNDTASPPRPPSRGCRDSPGSHPRVALPMMLNEQLSVLISERESLKVLNASLAEKNELLHAKLQKVADTGKELRASLLATLHAASTLSCVHLNENDRDEEEQWEHIECRQRSCGPPVHPAPEQRPAEPKPRWNVYEQTWNETVAQRTERERLEQEQAALLKQQRAARVASPR